RNFAATIRDGFLECPRLDNIAAQVHVAVNRGKAGESALLIERFDFQLNVELFHALTSERKASKNQGVGAIDRERQTLLNQDRNKVSGEKVGVLTRYFNRRILSIPDCRGECKIPH